MDQRSIFQSLTVGAKFDYKKFKKDAVKFKMVREEGPAPKRTRRTSDEEINDPPLPPAKDKKGREKRKERVNRIRNLHKIHIYGSDVPDLVESFANIPGMNETLAGNLAAAGYRDPTPIQMQGIPIMIQGREVLAVAPTGSGKTASFLIPIILSLRRGSNVGFRALILAPSRELAKQIYKEALRLAEGTTLQIFMINQLDITREKFKTKKKCDLLVTTPNRLVHLLKEEAISLKNVLHFVVDEVDQMFEGGFRDQLGTVYSACDGPKVLRWFFSATCAFEVEEFCRAHLDSHLKISIGAGNAAVENIDQELTFTGTEAGKLFAFRELINKGLEVPMLVFVSTLERANELFKELLFEGTKVDVIHSEKTQGQRERIVEGFRSGKIWILICTALMARGVDFPAVKLVLNYDLPTTASAYIHAVGRTGRAGRKGKAITFFTEEDKERLRTIANVLVNSGFPVPAYLLTLRKKRREKDRELRAPSRPPVRPTSIYDDQRARRKAQIIAQSKEKKLKAAARK